MSAITNFVVAGVVTGALAGAVPAAAQYPAYGYPNGGYGHAYPNGYGQPYAGGYGGNTQMAVNRCADAVQARLNGGGYAYAHNNGGGRVLGIDHVYPSGYGGAVTVRGVASSGRNAPYAYGSSSPVDLTWQCTADYRGLVVGLSIQPAQHAYGNEGYQPAPYDNQGYQPAPYSNQGYQPAPYGNQGYQPAPYGNQEYQPDPYGNQGYQPPPNGYDDYSEYGYHRY